MSSSLPASSAVSQSEAAEVASKPVEVAHTSAAYASSLHHSLLGPSLLKAGQEGVDQAKVGEIIYNASKGSRFFRHEEKRDEQVPRCPGNLCWLDGDLFQLTKRIDAILERKKELQAGSLSNELRRVDEQVNIFRERTNNETDWLQIALLESQRDLSQCIVHVDCDAFYAV